ncbi:MAG: glutathione S-transferase [Hydrocarboniphaga sp.]|uniref:glutathione S-transferase family protein n=1 Tax=Hydrocarboniphaga sp. TaxID=2033016 RepID=UPI002607904B|nr:glutathione S-transferase family protein [Hydrocarboniphaga sp.]MDB5971659.1 glutathione S-transferase [Hydrocarboniphaga sp.]
MNAQVRPLAVPLLLHGYAVSNYFNTLRQALLEKEALFDIVRLRAGRDEAFLSRSPMGKIPYLQTPEGTLSETLPILEYLEETESGAPLYPNAPLRRGRTRQTMNIIQLYLDVPMRRLYPGVFSNAALNSAETLQAVAAQLEVTIEALRRLLVFKPYLLGDTLSCVDLLALYIVDVGDRVTRCAYGWSLIERIDGMRDWARLMQQRESTQVVAAEFVAEFQNYLADKCAPYRQEQGGGIFAPPPRLPTAAAA